MSDGDEYATRKQLPWNLSYGEQQRELFTDATHEITALRISELAYSIGPYNSLTVIDVAYRVQLNTVSYRANFAE